jgi:hypothetical protein
MNSLQQLHEVRLRGLTGLGEAGIASHATGRGGPEAHAARYSRL